MSLCLCFFYQTRILQAYRRREYVIYSSFSGDAKYVAVTYRLFKLPEAKQSAMSVTYTGNITGNEKELEFDHQNSFKV